MKLGNFQITTISGGRFLIDGGTMFGVVPKALWSQVISADVQNRIAQTTNCVLVDTGEHKVLIDTGYGSKLPEKQRKILCSEPDDPLLASLQRRGISVEEIGTVVLSHLHFDHAGGATQRTSDGQLAPTFANAQYIVQRKEWEIATAELPELRSAYPLDNLLPLQEAGCLRFIDGDVEILPGMRSLVTGGHTAAHQALIIESDGETAVYLADLCPTWRHLPTLWCMSYDVDLLQTRCKKPELLGQIADNDWLALSDHDPDHAAARLQRDEKRDFTVAEAFDEL